LEVSICAPKFPVSPILVLPLKIAPDSTINALVVMSPLRFALASRTTLSFALTVPATFPPIVKFALFVLAYRLQHTSIKIIFYFLVVIVKIIFYIKSTQPYLHMHRAEQ